MSDVINKEQELLNKAVEDGGSYSLIKKRLKSHGGELTKKLNVLNEQRQNEFGGVKNEIIGKLNIRTESNGVAIDMAQVGGCLFVGYDVVIGMKKKTTAKDIFSIYKIKENEDAFTAEEVSIDSTFLGDSKFQHSLEEMFRYYKETKLNQITKNSNRLYVSFQIGKKHTDTRVFQWLLNNDGSVVYLDDKGKDNFPRANPHDFKFIKCTRDDYISGKHPHISIEDKVFVETIGGDLTIKIEDNTSSGGGIYSEPVDDINQSLEDADVSYAVIGSLYVLRILPYREDVVRYFVYSSLTEKVQRIDSIGNSCVSLPEDHGIVFSNGYFLENGDFKIFEQENENLTYMQTMSSPNGEDYMIIFFDSKEGFHTVYSYNIIQKQLSSPIHAHGYSLYDDGKFFIFRVSENHEATKVHPMRVWQTPFVSDEFFNNQEREVTYLSNIGNSELVRGISDLYDVINYINKEEVTSSIYENLIKVTVKVIDDYHWLGDGNVGDILTTVKQISSTSDLVVDEFEKVKSIHKESNRILSEAIQDQAELINNINVLNANEISPNVQALAQVKQQIGRLIGIKEERYVDLDKVVELQKDMDEAKESVNKNLLSVLQRKESFDSYYNRIEKVDEQLVDVEKAVEIKPLEDESELVQTEIELIQDEISDIEVEDATIITEIIDIVSEVFSKLNQVKSKIKNKKKEFLSTESKTEFASQFKLLSQAVNGSVSKADTPDKCDEELSRLMNQVESLESKFAQFDEYLTDITKKREEIQDIFENHKLQLINELQKRIINIEKAANITLVSIGKKVETFEKIDDLNTYFASDSMVLKIYTFVESIRELNNVIKADDLEAKLKKIKDQSLRSLRDNQDIFEDGGRIMKMGKHKFTVNRSDVDLTILPIDNKLSAHLTGTDFYETIENDELYSLRDYWNIDLPSESNTLYRSEFLAYSIISDAEKGINDLSLEKLKSEMESETLDSLISKYAATRYKEGYVKGVHDYDANLILKSLLKVYFNVGLLKFSQKSRTLAILFDRIENKNKDEKDKNKSFVQNYEKAKVLSEKLNNFKMINAMQNELGVEIYDFYENTSIVVTRLECVEIAKYLSELRLSNKSASVFRIEVTKDSRALEVSFSDFLTKINMKLDNTLNIENYIDLRIWVESFVEDSGSEEFSYFIDEACLVYLMKSEKNISLDERGIKLTSKIEKLLGDHRLIDAGNLTVSLDDFMSRGKNQLEVVVPNYERYLEIRKNLAIDLRERLQLEDFKAKPLSSFVRNKLITNSYLHLIGDNLAKQIGTAGDSKRSDLMGMLLLISPPGYGKTTLIEYVANKLGLVFMKINCPSLNHSVVSLDPSEAPDATSRKELEKLNLGLEMGNNVLLYLDDIQHTNPEFLQKFISLCDGTRKIDGVWKGKPKTYDMKGKKFAVCMAGNPYTETGDAFTIPDMLANRADIYNLGDQLSGQEEVFELSYIENSLTSNSVLSPLANRDMEDLYKFVEMANGKTIPLNEFDHNYASAEANEVVSVIKKMLIIRDVVLKVNQQYIVSASVEAKYRSEPPFKLQGSYRNMNKMVEKVIPVMTDEEIMSLILDHYRGESQTLTIGAEDNYLKLKSLIGVINKDEQERYDAIMKDFSRHKLVGDSDTDGTTKIANQLTNLIDAVKEVGEKDSKKESSETDIMAKELELITDLIGQNKDGIRDNKKLMVSAFGFIKQLKNQMVSGKEKEVLVINLLSNLNSILDNKNKKKESL
jgi:hypothetical protein